MCRPVIYLSKAHRWDNSVPHKRICTVYMYVCVCTFLRKGTHILSKLSKYYGHIELTGQKIVDVNVRIYVGKGIFIFTSMVDY
jgi:hypothetical protein